MDINRFVEEEIEKRVKDEILKTRSADIRENKVPLEDIIDWCGEDLLTIRRYKDGWSAEGKDDLAKCGETIYEAVSSFYIYLASEKLKD